LNITWDDDEDECSENDEFQNDEDNDNSTSWLLLTSIEENEDHNVLIEDNIGEEEVNDENNENDIHQAYDDLYELCEIITKKNKSLKIESKRLVNDANILKDQLILKDNEIRNVQSKLITSNDNLAKAEKEIHKLQW